MDRDVAEITSKTWDMMRFSFKPDFPFFKSSSKLRFQYMWPPQGEGNRGDQACQHQQRGTLAVTVSNKAGSGVCIHRLGCHSKVPHTGSGPPSPGRPHLNQPHPRRPYFRLTSHSRVPGVRTSSFWGEVGDFIFGHVKLFTKVEQCVSSW